MRRVSLAARRAQQFLRRPPRPRWVRPARWAASGVLCGALLAAGAWWLDAPGAIERAREAARQQVLAWTRDLGLELRQVYVDGRARTDPEELRAALGLQTGVPLLAVDPREVKARLETLPWISQASVERLLPDTVFVRLHERQPLALWQQGGQFALIDSRGAVIEGAVPDATAAAAWRHLRVLVGEGAPAQAAPLFATLSTEPALWSRVVAATWVGDRRWTVRLDNRVDVLLPETDMRAAWRLLGRKQAEERLLERAVSVVDLRLLPERIRLRLDPAALEDQGA
jgi:cell division protein FtsQ